MADVLDNSLVNSGRTMLMPQVALSTGKISIRAGNSVHIAGTTGFYAGIESNVDETGYDTATLIQTVDTGEQVLVDTGTGQSGVVTQAIMPAGNVGGTRVMIITVDGVAHEFHAGAEINYSRSLLVGCFVPWKATNSVTSGVGYGSDFNEGYVTSANHEVTMLTLLDSVTRGLPFGLKFTDSMKITIESSNGFIAGSSSSKAVACWLNYIPEGV